MAPAAHTRLEGNFRSWTGALVCTLVLNLLLFSAIPNLMKPEETRPNFGPMIPQVHLTRLHRTKPEPVKKREAKPPVKARVKKKPDKPKMNRPATTALSIPFEVNTRLPGGPRTLALPEVMSKSLENLPLTTLFTPGDLDQPLTALSRIPPIYPFRAKARGIEGWVAVEFTVTEQGRVTDIAILSADPQEIFEQSVIQCVSAWRFEPGRISGEPVRTRVKTKIRFQLN